MQYSIITLLLGLYFNKAQQIHINQTNLRKKQAQVLKYLYYSQKSMNQREVTQQNKHLQKDNLDEHVNK